MIPRTGISVSKKELLGLLLVFIVYVLVGGVVFMLLESPREEKLRRELSELRDEFQEKLGRFGGHDANVSREDMERLMIRLAAAHSNRLIDETGNDTHTNWSFDNSFFFAITVVTTIGYGHLSPSTTEGRIFCLVYATVGIPLTGILLAAIGGHYSQHLVRRLQRARKSKNSRLAVVASASTCLLPWLLVFLVIPAGLFTFTERWSFVEGLYYCFITLSTIGFGDYVAGNFRGQYIWFYKVGVVLWIIFGLGYLAMILNYISRAMRCKQVRKIERKLSSSFYQTQQKVGQRLEEVYQIFQDMSRNRVIKPRHRGALKRIQSFPAPELRDRNHNHKLQNLLLAPNGYINNPVERPRRFSLPLPDSLSDHHRQPQHHGRGSLQVYSKIEITRNGSPWTNPEVTRTSLQVPILRNFDFDSLNVLKAQRDYHNSMSGVSVPDVVSATRYPGIDVISASQAVIDIEGLQCTRV